MPPIPCVPHQGAHNCKERWGQPGRVFLIFFLLGVPHCQVLLSSQSLSLPKPSP